jgi:hypothetical protein
MSDPITKSVVGIAGSVLNKFVAEWDSKYIEVGIKRKGEYPPLEDFADAMYWNSKGDDTKLTEYYAACDAVKAKYPKD